MRSPEHPKYEVGDEVRIWAVFKHPVGTVQSVNKSQSPVKYLVQYTYHDGTVLVESFEPQDLTLHRKYGFRFLSLCECGGSSTNTHSHWCPRFGKKE
jgi:hypothetical protein